MLQSSPGFPKTQNLYLRLGLHCQAIINAYCLDSLELHLMLIPSHLHLPQGLGLSRISREWDLAFSSMETGSWDVKIRKYYGS